MRYLRLIAIALSTLLIAVGCGGTDTEAGEGLGDDRPSPASGECGDELEATDVGITADEIRVAVIADTGSPLAPGLFQTSIDGVKAWAEAVNEAGGLACRRVVVDEYDSMISQNEAKAAVQEACTSAFSLLGTTALFFTALEDLEGCEDSAGNATGLPDFAVLQTEPAHQCSDVSYATIPGSGLCPYPGEGERDFVINTGPVRYLQENVEPDLHGVFLVPSDLPSTIATSIVIVRGFEMAGVGNDGEFGVGGRAPQSEFTPFVQALIENESNFAYSGSAVGQAAFFLNESRVQGVEGVTFLCLVQCYDRTLIEEGGDAAEGAYVSVNLVPFEEADQNPDLQLLLDKFGRRPDGFGLQAWLAGRLLEQVVADVVDQHGLNGVTRARVLEGVKAVTDFDGGGITPPLNIGGKEPSGCFAMLQVQGGEFVRVHPAEPGTFDCRPENQVRFSTDASKEFRG